MKSTNAASFLIIALLLASCAARGPKDGPDSITTESPPDKGSLGGSLLTAKRIPSAGAYELVLAASAEGLEAEPLFQKADYASNAMDVGDAPLLNKSSYWWKVRAKGADGSWGRWSSPSSFLVDWTKAAESPAFNPPGGIYKRDQSVTLSSKDSRAKIWYTIDGHEPTTASAPYAGPIKVAGDGESRTIKAIALAPGFVASAPSSARYSIKYPSAATPTMSPSGGTYSGDQSVTIACATKGAEIHYTTDGSEPTKSSPLYAEAIEVAGDGSMATIKAIAFAPRFSASPVGGQSFEIRYELAATPSFRPAGGSYSKDQRVAIVCPTRGAEIHFTIDGSEPTKDSPLYTGELGVAGDGAALSIKAIAIAPGFAASTVGSASYSISYAPASAPAFAPREGSFPSDQSVTISSSTRGAEIHYTTDGSAPGLSSTLYSSPIPVSGHGQALTIRAVAIAPGFALSSEGRASYVIRYPQASAPVFSPESGTYSADLGVTIASVTRGAEIRYTTDGGEPTKDSKLYDGPIAVAGHGRSATIRAIVLAPGRSPSEEASAKYAVAYPPAAAPVFLPSAGTYATDQAVTLASPTKGAEIRYTTDGSEPTAASKLYAEPIPVAGDGKSRTIKAFAAAPGYSASIGASASYAIKYVPTATPAFSPASGSYATEQSVSIACPTEGAVIYYSLSTSGAPADPTADSPVYSKPIAVGAGVTTTIKAMALQPGGGLGYSAIASALYNRQLEMVGVPGGSYASSSQTVTVSSFSMSKYEITKKLYQAITGSSPSYFIEDDSRPVEQVTWYDAVEFCNLLSLREGRAPVYAISARVPPAGYPITGASVTADWSKNGYRLPTEAEWEYAARGGKASRRLTYAGSNDPNAVGWSKGNSGNATHPVGTKAPNELGLYDLSGNVWEWCWDLYGPYPSGPRSDPLGASAGTTRVQRGGSWYDIDKFGTVSSRGYYDPSATVINFGFRVVYRD